MDSGSGAGMTTEGAGMTAGEAGMTRSGAATTEQGRWRAYEYDELIARDKVSLDIFWLRDDSLADTDNLPPPGVIAAEIVEDLEAALEQMRLIAEDLEDPASEVEADEA
jgi:type I restriction enzyme M protein